MWFRTASARIPTVLLVLLLSGSGSEPASALRFDLGLPGGGKVSYRDGLLRIRPPTKEPKAVLEVPWDDPELLASNGQSQPLLKNALRHEFLGDDKGFGVVYGGNDLASELPAGTFLGLYQGELIEGRETLERLHADRARALEAEGRPDEARKVSDYVVALDGGLHFLDGFGLRHRGEKDDAVTNTTGGAFVTPAHFNHARADDPGCNVVRNLVYLPDDSSTETSKDGYPRGLPRVAFFAGRSIRAGEELALDYGSNFWKN